MPGQAAMSPEDSEFEDWLSWLEIDGDGLVAIMRYGLLKSYADAGTTDGGTFIVCACLFGLPQARRFRRDWQPLFSRWDGGLHMKDFAGGWPPYDDVSQETRDAILQQAIPVFCENVEAVVVVLCHEFDADKLPVQNPGYQSVYAICCRFAALSLDQWCVNNGRGERIEYVFEAGDENQGESKDFFRFVAKYPKMREEFRFAGHDYKMRKDVPMLQAADMFAWESGKYWDESHLRHERAPRASFMAMVEALGSAVRRPAGQSGPVIIQPGGRLSFHHLYREGFLREQAEMIRYEEDWKARDAAAQKLRAEGIARWEREHGANAPSEASASAAPSASPQLPPSEPEQSSS